MRNFYLKAEMSGRATPLAGGPAARSGEMTATISANVQGQSTPVVTVECWPGTAGQLHVETTVTDPGTGEKWTMPIVIHNPQ